MPKRVLSPSQLFKRAIRGWSADQLRAAIAADEEATLERSRPVSQWELGAMKAELRRRDARAARIDREEGAA